MNERLEHLKAQRDTIEYSISCAVIQNAPLAVYAIQVLQRKLIRIDKEIEVLEEGIDYV